MLKDELIKTVNDSSIEPTLKTTITSFIGNTWDIAYQQGFQEGMKRASQIQNATLDMVMGKHVKRQNGI